MKIFKTFTFDSAHFLPHVPDGHKCKNTHGHTYRLTVYFEGRLHQELGWVEDFADIKKVVKPIVDQLDHQLMNNIEGLENPTCEVIAIWLWDRIKTALPSLSRVELHETPTSGAIYEGEW